MKCGYPACTKAVNGLFCENCYSVSYCGIACKSKHYNSEHMESCPGTIEFKLTDFEDAGEVLGTGPSSEVRLMRHTPSAAVYVLKILDKEQIEEESIGPMISQEIALHRSLIHPNILRLYGTIENDRSLYLILEHAPGGTVFSRIPVLNNATIRKYFRQICETVLFLHGNKVFYRGIKAESVLLDANDNVKLCGFRWSVQDGGVRETFCGDCDYMAPEMVQGEPYDYSADIWALGVLLYELLHGFCPFTSSQTEETCKRISDRVIQFDSTLDPHARDLILKILKSDSNERPEIEMILKHPFLSPPEETAVAIGTRFSYNRLGFGHTDAIIEKIEGENYVILFEEDNEREIVNSRKIERIFRKHDLSKQSSAFSIDLVTLKEGELTLSPGEYSGNGTHLSPLDHVLKPQSTNYSYINRLQDIEKHRDEYQYQLEEVFINGSLQDAMSLSPTIPRGQEVSYELSIIEARHSFDSSPEFSETEDQLRPTVERIEQVEQYNLQLIAREEALKTRIEGIRNSGLSKAPRRARRPRNPNGSFLVWVGSFFGCGE